MGGGGWITSVVKEVRGKQTIPGMFMLSGMCVCLCRICHSFGLQLSQRCYISFNHFFPFPLLMFSSIQESHNSPYPQSSGFSRKTRLFGQCVDIFGSVFVHWPPFSPWLSSSLFACLLLRSICATAVSCCGPASASGSLTSIPLPSTSPLLRPPVVCL